MKDGYHWWTEHFSNGRTLRTIVRVEGRAVRTFDGHAMMLETAEQTGYFGERIPESIAGAVWDQIRRQRIEQAAIDLRNFGLPTSAEAISGILKDLPESYPDPRDGGARLPPAGNADRIEAARQALVGEALAWEQNPTHTAELSLRAAVEAFRAAVEGWETKR